MNPAKLHHADGFVARRLVGTTRNSINGLRFLCREEAFRVELGLFMILAPLGYWFGDTGLERAALIGSLTLVIVVETLNTAIEAAINRISFDLHPLSGEAKDLGSAAVLLALLLTVIVWVLVLMD